MMDVKLYLFDDTVVSEHLADAFIGYSDTSFDTWRQVIMKNQQYYEGTIQISLNGKPIFGIEVYDTFNDLISYFQTACRLIINGSNYQHFYLPSQPYNIEFAVTEKNFLELKFDEKDSYVVPKDEFLFKVLEQCKLFHQIEYKITQSEYAYRDLQEAEDLLYRLKG